MYKQSFKMRVVFYFFLIYSVIACTRQTESYYVATDNLDRYALLKISQNKDSIRGNIITLHYPDTISIRGFAKDNDLYFQKEEDFVRYKVFGMQKISKVGNNKFGFKDDRRFLMEPISLEMYDSIARQYILSYPISVHRDTLMGKYSFHIQIKKWKQSTEKGDVEIRIRERNTNKEIQTITAKNSMIFIRYNLPLAIYLEDYNNDGCLDLSFLMDREPKEGHCKYIFYYFDPIKQLFFYDCEKYID